MRYFRNQFTCNVHIILQVVVAAGEYTTGSAWLSEEKLLEQARDMWKRLSDEQKGAYGEDYFEQALRSLEKYTKNAVSPVALIFELKNA